MNKYIVKTAIFPDNINNVFDKLQKISTLQKIAFPFAAFKPVKKIENSWESGRIFKLHLKLFCIIPLGIHTIRVIRFDKNEIFTNESNKFIPVWNHRIYLKALNNCQTEYTDMVEINAGRKTFFVYLWAKLFYSHRQRKWKKLLNRKK